MSFQQQFKDLIRKTNCTPTELSAVIDTILQNNADPAVLLFMAVEADHLPAVKYLLILSS